MTDRLVKECSRTSGSHSCAFHSAAHFFFSPFFSKIWMWTSVEHMRDNWVSIPSPVSRSSPCSRYCGCGIRLSAHHFWYLQFPHLQVSLIASSWSFLSVLLLAQTEELHRPIFVFISKKERERARERERHVWKRVYGSCCYRCQCGIYTIVAMATAQQVMV